MSRGGGDVVVASGRPSNGEKALKDAFIAQLTGLDGVASARGEHIMLG